ncbi:hypothetical protein [Candidatus Parabeggiatoa sp. HSG14]|uniref:hypothetical protein n=1 Tax=Candidatus Parabeggiatoa sp. HSG14 TaxID=3055593 RepID=UPI0025A8AB22|nr:hypothetical protein [Thiotrichales bacterium HSG14]
MIQSTIGVQALQNQLYQEVKYLSSKNLSELINFVNYLKYRDGLKTTNKPVRLEGLWEDIHFDVTDEDVRALRQQLTQQTEDKLNALLS